MSLARVGNGLLRCVRNLNASILIFIILFRNANNGVKGSAIMILIIYYETKLHD